MEKHTRHILSYGEGRQVEDLVKQNWTKNGYRNNFSDEKIAAIATKLLKIEVTPRNVIHIREQVGMVDNSYRLGKILGKDELSHIEHMIEKYHNVVCTKKPNHRLYVTTIDKYIKRISDTKKAKPWLKTKRVMNNEQSHTGDTDPHSPE